MELVLYVSRLGRIMVVRIKGMWIWLGMKDCEWKWSLGSDCRRAFVKDGELVGCEELARLLQKTYSKRLTAYGIWKNVIASRLVKSGGGKNSTAAVRYGGEGR